MESRFAEIEMILQRTLATLHPRSLELLPLLARKLESKAQARPTIAGGHCGAVEEESGRGEPWMGKTRSRKYTAAGSVEPWLALVAVRHAHT